MTTLDCGRCGSSFGRDAPHTSIVRRDLVDEPQPPQHEYLCARCWRSYVEDFLDEDFGAEADVRLESA